MKFILAKLYTVNVELLGRCLVTYEVSDMSGKGPFIKSRPITAINSWQWVVTFMTCLSHTFTSNVGEYLKKTRDRYGSRSINYVLLITSEI